MNKLWDKICIVGTHISALLVLGAFVLVPLAVVIGTVKLMLHWLGVI